MFCYFENNFHGMLIFLKIVLNLKNLLFVLANIFSQLLLNIRCLSRDLRSGLISSILHLAIYKPFSKVNFRLENVILKLNKIFLKTMSFGLFDRGLLRFEYLDISKDFIGEFAAVMKILHYINKF